MASIVFFGNERLATGVTTTAPTLQALIAAGYDVKAVITNYEKATSRNARELEISKVAEANNIPVLTPNKPIDIIEDLRNMGAEVAVLAAYGRIVPQEIIDLFPRGIVNIHPSLLPLHRGPTPLESVILNGESTTGVSIMCLSAEMDAGPIYGQSEITLTGSETKQELADYLLEIGSKMVTELLPGILDGNIIPKPQDNERATYDKLIQKQDGVIDWSKPAIRLEREVRAYQHWPKSSAKINGYDVILTTVHAEIDVSTQMRTDQLEHGKAFIAENSELAVSTGDGLLIIDTLKPIGKNEMTAKDFLAGYKK